jgi:L-methionine (R)-S-oxide reductase
VPLDSFVLVTPGVANFYTYIEYFPPRGVQPFSMAFHITAAAEANTLADLIVEQGHEPPGHPVSKLRFSVDSTNGRIILFRTPGSDDPDERMAVGAAQGFQFGIEAGQERTFHIPKLDTGLRMTEVFVQTESVANFVAYAEFHEHVMAERELSETVLRNARPTVAAWLSDFVERHGGFMGSVHLTEPAAEGEMVLVAAHNLSVGIQNGAAIAEVGKGMAGVTAERREPLAFPDLKADRSDIPHPEDRSSGSRGSVIVPVLSSDGSSLVAVVGLGFPEPRDFGEAEIATYTSDAERVRELV